MARYYGRRKTGERYDRGEPRPLESATPVAEEQDDLVLIEGPVEQHVADAGTMVAPVELTARVLENKEALDKLEVEGPEQPKQPEDDEMPENYQEFMDGPKIENPQDK
jgi:hypothetical protein